MYAVFPNHEIEAVMDAIQSEQIHALMHMRRRAIAWLEQETDAALADRFTAQCVICAIDDALAGHECEQPRQAVA